MSNKLLVVSGPTATGKTALAVKLAKKFNGELISADSRQVYRGMDIGTGKDHPKNVKIHLVDVVNPDQNFSAFDYRRLVLPLIQQIWNRRKLPIIVGGTGFYINSVIAGPTDTYHIKPNKILRFFLNKFSLKLLQSTLKFLDFQTFNLLNRSDSANPRRLIRKIEIKLFSHGITDYRLPITNYNLLHLSMTATNRILFSRIDQRVEDRLNLGQLAEIKNLLTKYHWSDPGLKVSAYASFQKYFTQKEDYSTAVLKWKFAEHRDARRQKTWFKKRTNIIFIDITRPCFPAEVFKLVSRWYN